MTAVDIVLSPSAEVEVIVEGDAPTPVEVGTEVDIVIESPGPQGPQGLAGPPGPPIDIFTLPLAP